MKLDPLPRLASALGAWAVIWLASPGIVLADGSALLALAGLVLWGLAASRPGKKAFLIEWLCASIGISAICWWSTLVVWITLLAVAIVPALYMALAGVLLRRLVRSVPLALALPAAWCSLETLRAWVEPPLGFGWLRLGHYASAIPWLAGSARVFGVLGLSFALAGLAGALADWIGERMRMTARDTAPTGAGQAKRVWIARALASGPLALAPVLSLATSPPPMEKGPRLLLVQPSFEQHRKMNPLSAEELQRELLEQTRAGLAAGGKIDLVCWGESLFPWPIAENDLTCLARPPEWVEFPTKPEHARWMEAMERRHVRQELFESGLLPAGCSFLSGAEIYVARDEELRRTTGAMVWGPKGKRLGWGGKLHLVPGGETMAGLERWAWVRDTAFSMAGYVPDLVPALETGVVEVPIEGFRPVRLGLSVCFDNTFDDPYTAPLRRGPVDAHVVLSNEAWYEETCEYDHMLAFSRLAAIESGRAMARVTNSGISCLIGADGSELARLTVGGKDRMVGGALAIDLPVPTAGHAGEETPYVRFELLLRWLVVLFPLGLLLVWRSRAVTRPG